MLDKLRHIKRKLLPSFVILAGMLTGCINDDSLCPAVNDGDEGVTIEFKVITRAAQRNGTRALVKPSEDNLQPGTASENYLDLQNTVFMLFDDTQTLIKVFKPNVEADDDTYATYSVRAFLSATEFEELTEGKTNVTFSIAVVGNFSRLNPQNAAYHIGQSLEDIFDPAKVATFAMPIRNNNGSSWIPSIYPGANGQESRQIPMAGIQTYNVSVAALAASTVADPLDLSENGKKDINMLRALAKIEIVDRIDYGSEKPNEQPTPYNRTWIEKVELVGHTNRGSLFPTFKQWNLNDIVETQYVTEPSWISSYGYTGANPSGNQLTVTNGAALVDFFEDAAATIARDDKCQVFSCYLTEYYPRGLTVNDPKMWIRITAQGPLQEDSEPTDNTSQPYRLEVAPYTNGEAGASMPILRNNIYRYEITGLSPDLALTLMVDDWKKSETSWSYKANPAMAESGEIEWTDVPDGNLNRNTARVVCTYGQDLTATFTFAEPEGGTWTARLVTQSGDSKAFAFVGEDGYPLIDEDGYPLDISGKINGAESTIKIRPLLAPGLNSREARLIFTVFTPDERTISANVLGTQYNGNTYFTIVQNPS